MEGQGEDAMRSMTENFIKNIISMVRRDFWNALQSKFDYEVLKETSKIILLVLLASFG
jgi:hypothetical protein